jgi:hypothetical protein
MATDRLRQLGWLAASLVQGALLAACAASPAKPAIPLLDLPAFLERRAMCDHFRGEFPDPPDPERMRDVLEQIQIQCTGIDEQLDALKQRYRDDPVVSRQLAQFETGLDPRPR